jgi:hypothetical protein
MTNGTKETIVRYMNPILISMVGALVTALGIIIWSLIGSVSTKVDAQGALRAETAGKLDVLNQSVEDYIKLEEQTDTDLKNIAADHESRIRTLEKPH